MLQPPFGEPAELHPRVAEPSVALVIENVLPDFERDMIVYASAAAAATVTWPVPEPIGRPVVPRPAVVLHDA